MLHAVIYLLFRFHHTGLREDKGSLLSDGRAADQQGGGCRSHRKGIP